MRCTWTSGAGGVVRLSDEETERRWQATTPQWPIMHAVLYGVSRDQLMAAHQANHIQVAYAPDAAERPAGRWRGRRPWRSALRPRGAARRRPRRHAGLPPDRRRSVSERSRAARHARRASGCRFPGSARWQPSTSTSGPVKCTPWSGENGAGKSTLGRMLGGEMVPDEGRLIIAGTPALAPLAPRGPGRRRGDDPAGVPAGRHPFGGREHHARPRAPARLRAGEPNGVAQGGPRCPRCGRGRPRLADRARRRAHPRRPAAGGDRPGPRAPASAASSWTSPPRRSATTRRSGWSG